MSEFESEVQLDVEVSQASLRAARAEIEDEIGTVTAEASASNQLTSGAGGGSGGVLNVLEDNLGLDETRNDLLREILDAQEMTARSGGGGGSMLGSIGGGALAIGGGAVGLAVLLGDQLASVNWSEVVGDAIPDLNPEDVVDPVALAASDVVDEAAEVEAGDVVDTGIEAADIIGDALPVGAAALVASSLPVAAGALVAEELPVDAAALVAETLPVGAADVLAENLPVGAADVIEEGLPVGLEDLLAGAFPLGVGALLASEFPIKPGDIFGSGDPSGDGSPSGDGGGGGFPWLEIIGGGAAGAGLFKTLGGSGALSRALGTTSGGAVFTPEMFEDTAFGDLTTDPEDVDSDKPTLGEIVTGTEGHDGSTIDGVPVNSENTSLDGLGKRIAQNLRNSNGSSDPPSMSSQRDVVTVGGDGSNRNDTGGEQRIRMTGDVEVRIDDRRDIEQQLRRQEVPEPIVDAVAKKLERRMR